MDKKEPLYRKIYELQRVTFVEAMTDIHALELCVKDKRHAWMLQKVKIERQFKGLQEQTRHLEQKRR